MNDSTYLDDFIRVCDEVCFDQCMHTVRCTFPGGTFADADIDAIVDMWHAQLLDRLIDTAVDAYEDGLSMHDAISECIEECLEPFIAAAAPIRQGAEERADAEATEMEAA